MKTSSSAKLLLFPLVVWLAYAMPVEAAQRPFKAPSGTHVSYYSSGKDIFVWTIAADDYSATAAVGKVKLPRAYWKGKAFERYIRNYFKNNQTFSAYGIDVKASWKNGAYTISGTSNGYRVYAKGRLSKSGFWLYGSVVGQPSPQTRRLIDMIKELK